MPDMSLFPQRLRKDEKTFVYRKWQKNDFQYYYSLIMIYCNIKKLAFI